jgi:hypothetical protein
VAHGALDLNCNLALADGANRGGGHTIEKSRAARYRAQQMLALGGATNAMR